MSPHGGGIQVQAVAAGVVFTFLASLVLSGLLALVVYFSSLSETSASGALFYLGLASLAAGSAYGARRATGLGWLHGAAIGALYVILSVLVSLVLFPGGVGGLDLLQRLALGIGVGAVGGVLGVNL